MTRLSEATLPLATGAELPRYDRTPPPSIVHLGVGAFARAHLAVYADDLLRAGWPATIRGVSLRSRRAEDQLAPQDGLFSVTTRAAEPPATTRVVGSLTSVSTGAEPAAAAIADPATSLVTLTITEKGYDPAEPGSVPALLAAALDQRRSSTSLPLVIASLDNLIDNGHVLQQQVLRAADPVGGGLGAWITETVSFPRSVVDRMVPATGHADIEAVGQHLGLVDEAAVIAEPHRSWVIEEVEGLPPLDRVGVELVADIEPYQQRKLWLLNGPHSALAYAGLVTGHQTIAAAASDPVVASFVQGLIAEVLEIVPFDRNDGSDFAQSALSRFHNPSLGHQCAQVAADGSVKLSQRILPVMALRERSGRASPRLALVVATWLAIVTATPVAGRDLPMVHDPEAESVRATMQAGGVEAAIRAVLGLDLLGLAGEVAEAFDLVARKGASAFEALA